MKKAIIITLVLLVTLALFGCSKSQVENEIVEPSYRGQSGVDYKSSDSNEVIDGQQLKVIVNSSVNMESNDLDATLEKIYKQVQQFGGYVQYSYTGNNNYYNGRFCELTIRIPAEQFDEFVETCKETGNVTSSKLSTTDITSEYYDLQSRLDSTKAQADRVLEFYKQATTISELIEIEARLSELQSEIDIMDMQMKNYDLLTQYSTLELVISEVKMYSETDDNFFARLWSQVKDSAISFVNFLQNVLFFVIDAIWYIVLIALILFAIKKTNNKYHYLDKISFKKKNKQENS